MRNTPRCLLRPPPRAFTTNNKLPKTPKSKFNLSPQYELGLSNSGRMRFGVDYTHTADLFNDAPNSPLLHRPSVDNLNASIQYLSPDDKYQLSVGGTNLTDERYITVGSVNGAEGETVGTYSRPREWYLTLRINLE